MLPTLHPHDPTRVQSAEIDGSPWVLWWGAMFGVPRSVCAIDVTRNQLDVECGEV